MESSQNDFRGKRNSFLMLFAVVDSKRPKKDSYNSFSYLKNINAYDNFIIIHINTIVCILVYSYYTRCHLDDNVYLSRPLYWEKKCQLCMHKSFINVSQTKHFVMIATPLSYIQNDTNSNLCINMLHHNNITIGFLRQMLYE